MLYSCTDMATVGVNFLTYLITSLLTYITTRTCFGDVDGDVIELIGHRVLDVAGDLDLLTAGHVVVIYANLERTAWNSLPVLRHLNRVRAFRLGLERRNTYSTINQSAYSVSQKKIHLRFF